MPEQAYTYSISDDFPDGVADITNLAAEITASAIVTALERIDVNPANDDEDRLDIVFKAALSTGDKTILDGDTTGPSGGLIAQHDTTHVAAELPVAISNVATMSNPNKEVQRVAIQPGRSGYYMNFRDFKLKTGLVANTFEDLKVDPTTMKRKSWGELFHIGCYKGDDTNGYTQCADQADADANAVLSVWEFLANDQAQNPTNVDIDLMGGSFWVDGSLSGTGDDLWKHQVYALLAPDIPTSMGGAVPFFDSYLYPNEGQWMNCVNTMALALDPSASPSAAKVRVYVYYPAGAKQTHLLALKMYRNKW